MRIIGDEDETPDDTRREVEDEVARAAERPLDVVAEHPQKDHVAEEVPDIGMNELIGDERRDRRERAPCRDISPQGGRREAEGVDHPIEPGLRGDEFHTGRPADWPRSGTT